MCKYEKNSNERGKSGGQKKIYAVLNRALDGTCVLICDTFANRITRRGGHGGGSDSGGDGPGSRLCSHLVVIEADQFSITFPLVDIALWSIPTITALFAKTSRASRIDVLSIFFVKHSR